MQTTSVGILMYPYINYASNEKRRVPLVYDSGANATLKPYSDLRFYRNESGENDCVHRKASWYGNGVDVRPITSGRVYVDYMESSNIVATNPKIYQHCRVYLDGRLYVMEYWTCSGTPGAPGVTWTGGKNVYDPNIMGKDGIYDTIWRQITKMTATSQPFNWGMEESITAGPPVMIRTTVVFSHEKANIGPTIGYDDINFDIIFDYLDAIHQRPSGLVSQAFRDATDTLRLTTNNVANAVEVVSLATSLATSGPFGAILNVKREVKALSLGAKLAPNILKDIAKHCPQMAARDLLKNEWSQKLAESWLWYRYAYQTTKMDIEEIHAKAGKLAISDQGWHTIRSSITVPEGSLHCKASVWKRNSDPASEIAIRLWEYGLQLDAYACWDMVPLSFVVDWFTDIGSRLEDKSSDFVHTSAVFDIPSVLYSWKYSDTVMIGNFALKCTSYTRWEQKQSPPFEYYEEDTSSGTIIRRVLDGAALTITSLRSRL